MDIGKPVKVVQVPEKAPAEQPIPLPDNWPIRVPSLPVRVPQEQPA